MSEGRQPPITVSGQLPPNGEPPSYAPLCTAPEWPWDERTARAIVGRLEASPHRVHQGAANIIASEFLPDGTVGRAMKLAAERGWPQEAVLAGLKLAKEQRP